MKRGRLKIVNESRYPDAEVESLVKFGLEEIDVKGSKLLVAVTNTRKSAYRGYGGERHHFIDRNYHVYHLARAANAEYAAHVMIGAEAKFPIVPFSRNGTTWDYQTWQEALVGVTAHEAMHVQFCYDDAPYGARSLVSRLDYEGGRAYRRLGDQRVEPKCEAFEQYMLNRFRSAA